MNAPIPKRQFAKGRIAKEADRSPQSRRALLAAMQKLGREAQRNGLTQKELRRILRELKQA